MAAVVVGAIMSAVEMSKDRHVHDGNLVTLSNTPVSVNTLKSTRGLMYATTMRTTSFTKIKSATIMFYKTGT